jgi:hypothetical protein
MRNLIWIGAAAAMLAATAFTTPVAAQDQTELNEIVVTGSRIQRYDQDVAASSVPAVTVTRRADNLIVSIRVVNDTRETVGRRNELIQTLRSMARAAGSQPDIALSIEDDGQLVAFNDDMVSTLTLGVDGNRADTSTASLIVKTPIRADDTLDSASSRIEQFIARVEKSGRSLVSINGGWQLSIINPEQYRPSILEAIAADARRTSAMFGEGYAVEVGGMANTLTWVQSGPLDLALFVPYTMAITPRS